MSSTNIVVLDLRDLGVNQRGVARALEEIGTRLLTAHPARYRAVCSAEGVPLLRGVDRDRLTVVRPHAQALFEQFTLPRIASCLEGRAVYSLRECGALWGPPLLLHVTEDPEVRWSRETLKFVGPGGGFGREIARRCYSRLVMNWSLRRARVATLTSATAADLERTHGLPADRATVVPLGVDVDRFRPVGPGDRTEPPYLFHLSSIDPREHTPVVVHAFAHLAARMKEPVRLVVAGDLGPTKKTIAGLVSRLGLEGRVQTPGRVSDERLVELYSGAVATVNASMDEGFGLQALEALACGSMLISTPAPATLEIAGQAEVQWTPLSCEPMAAAMEAVWTDPARRDRAAVTNRRVAAEYSWDVTVRRLHELLCQLADGIAPPGASPTSG